MWTDEKVAGMKLKNAVGFPRVLFSFEACAHLLVLQTMYQNIRRRTKPRRISEKNQISFGMKF
jgi:hypothetical protein